MNLLAQTHSGMRVCFSGLVKAFCGRKVGAGEKFVLTELLKNLQKVAARYYAGDISGVDEFFQCYCLDDYRGVALGNQALDATPITNNAAIDGWSGDAIAVPVDVAESLERSLNAAMSELRLSQYSEAQLMIRVKEGSPIIFAGGIRYEQVKEEGK